MEINIFNSYNDLEFHVSKREQLNYCRFETLLRIAVWGLFIFRGGAIFFQEYSNTSSGGQLAIHMRASIHMHKPETVVP